MGELLTREPAMKVSQLRIRFRFGSQSLGWKRFRDAVENISDIARAQAFCTQPTPSAFAPKKREENCNRFAILGTRLVAALAIWHAVGMPSSFLAKLGLRPLARAPREERAL